MSSFVIELEEEEIDNICLALAHATIKNDNKQAAEELDKLCEKLLRYASSTTAIAVKNYENVGEQTMRDKQIEEMAKVIKSSLDGLGSGNFNFTGDEISTMFAKALYNAGYRKASDVAREIFEEIEDVLNNIGYFDEIDFRSLKKKYLGEDINVNTKESEGEG